MLWILPALIALAAGWFASSWFYNRKLKALQALHKVTLQGSAERGEQVKRQIAKLQLELASRPPLRAAPQAPAAGVAAVRDQAASAARRALVDQLVPDDGRAPSGIGSSGFASTQVMATVPGDLG